MLREDLSTVSDADAAIAARVDDITNAKKRTELNGGRNEPGLVFELLMLMRLRRRLIWRTMELKDAVCVELTFRRENVRKIVWLIEHLIEECAMHNVRNTDEDVSLRFDQLYDREDRKYVLDVVIKMVEAT